MAWIIISTDRHKPMEAPPRFDGPFENKETAEKYANVQYRTDWFWVVELQEIKPWINKQFG